MKVTWRIGRSLESDAECIVELANGAQHRRMFHLSQDADYIDLKIASGFWADSQQAAGLDHQDAVLTFQSLAIKTLFPDLRPHLPA